MPNINARPVVQQVVEEVVPVGVEHVVQVAPQTKTRKITLNKTGQAAKPVKKGKTMQHIEVEVGVFSKKQQVFVDALTQAGITTEFVTRKQIVELVAKSDGKLKYPFWICGGGLYGNTPYSSTGKRATYKNPAWQAGD